MRKLSMIENMPPENQQRFSARLVVKGRKIAFCSALALVIPTFAFAANYARQAAQFALTGPLVGDQTNPQLSIRPGGGYVVWQDNITDGDGLGISARRLDSSLSGSLGVFRVNVQGTNDQEKPNV